MHVRPLELPRDRSAIVELAEAVAVLDGQAPLSEHKYTTVTQSPPDGARGVVGEDRAGTVVAYAAVVPASATGEWGLELAIQPEFRTNDAIRAMVEEGRRVASKEGGQRLRLWLYTDHLVEHPETLGFSPERQLLRMSRPLPTDMTPEVPPSISIAGFRPGVDEEAWLRVNNAAFRHHPENGGWRQADLEERMAMAWFNAEGFRLAWQGDELVGFCWTKIHPDGAGEIYVIGVAPEHHGRGLGKMLVLEGIRYLSQVGAPEVFLYCEAANTGARALYEKLGFEVERIHRAFIADLAPPDAKIPD